MNSYTPGQKSYLIGMYLNRTYAVSEESPKKVKKTAQSLLKIQQVFLSAIKHSLFKAFFLKNT